MLGCTAPSLAAFVAFPSTPRASDLQTAADPHPLPSFGRATTTMFGSMGPVGRHRFPIGVVLSTILLLVCRVGDDDDHQSATDHATNTNCDKQTTIQTTINTTIYTSLCVCVHG